MWRPGAPCIARYGPRRRLSSSTPLGPTMLLMGSEPAHSETSSRRIDGHAPIRDYAAIGDGRTVALVARDASIDWLPLPDLDSPAVFAAVLDLERGGCFSLEPEEPSSSERRYLPGTNVLETTFTTASGAVRVTDAMTLRGTGLEPVRELQRRIEGLSGNVRMSWRVEPRFGYGGPRTRIGRRAGVPIASAGSDAFALCSYQAGEPRCCESAIAGHLEVDANTRALLALSFAHQEPLVLPTRRELDRRFEETCLIWSRWTEGLRTGATWRKAVERSALALKLLVHAPSGAVAAAATTSLPEELGGERNWDYRFSWVRDSAFVLDAFLQLGCPTEARAYFWWLMHASQLTSPHLRVLYRLNGGSHAPERELRLAGYRNSRPVRAGNAAAEQLQLDTYGELMQTAWLYALAGNRLDADVARRFADTANLVCESWRWADSGIWEVRSEPLHFTQSKMMCWVALDRAQQLADRGILPSRNASRWRREAAAIRAFVETECWSAAKRSYVRFAGGDELDASLLLGLLHGYGDPDDGRQQATVRAIDRELRKGPFVKRYTGDDGLTGSEGAFLASSFWLVEALARSGHAEEGADLMHDLVDLANDVGLYSEEIDPVTGEFLGNTPQALTHLALISSAAALEETGT
jgi:GH15 family glucan-1,4-alpha-glucosidase